MNIFNAIVADWPFALGYFIVTAATAIIDYVEKQPYMPICGFWLICTGVTIGGCLFTNIPYAGGIFFGSGLLLAYLYTMLTYKYHGCIAR